MLDEATLVRRAAELLPAVVTPTRAERACQQVYAQTLYAAVQDPPRREPAYRELHAYLYRIAQRQRPLVAEDAAQEAILLVCRNIHTCRDPGAFLKFAIFQLLTAFHRLNPRREEVSLDDLLEPDQQGEPGVELPADEPDLAIDLERKEKAADLLRWLHCMIDANPRARNQILVVALTYLEEREDNEIAAMLDTTVANVHVLRSRGLKKLRAEYRKQMTGGR